MGEAQEQLLCACMCSNCRDSDKCHYSSYHCHHARDDDRYEYGDLESIGFCIKTGFMPDRSWRRQYSWGEQGRFWPGVPFNEVGKVIIGFEVD